MAEPLKKPASASPGSGPSAQRPVRGRSERDIGNRSKRTPRGESQRPPRGENKGNGGSRSGGRQRIQTAGGSGTPRRPRDVKAGSGARILAPLAVALAALACFIVLTNQSSDGKVSSSGEAASAKSTSASESGESANTTGPTRSTYRVKAGDSFSAIAEAQGIDVEALQELNPDVDPRALQPGQKLKLKE